MSTYTVEALHLLFRGLDVQGVQELLRKLHAADELVIKVYREAET